MLVQRAENPRGRGGGRPAAARASHRESVPLPADTRIILYREKTRSSMYDIRLMGGLAVGGIWCRADPMEHSVRLWFVTFRWLTDRRSSSRSVLRTGPRGEPLAGVTSYSTSGPAARCLA